MRYGDGNLVRSAAGLFTGTIIERFSDFKFSFPAAHQLSMYVFSYGLVAAHDDTSNTWIALDQATCSNGFLYFFRDGALTTLTLAPNTPH